MPTTEHTINDALASVLKGGRQAWRDNVIHSETTGMLKGVSARPDILVLEPDVSPVAIETEVIPAPTVEPEALSRLGANIKSTGRTILSSIAVKLPKRLRNFSNGTLRAELMSASDLEMALFTGTSPTKAARWPHNQWISGSVSDLSILTQAASVPPEVIDRAADELISGIREAAGLFDEAAASHEGALQKISRELRQEAGEQTWRMASAILANAFVFHEGLAGGPGKLSKVRSIEELKGEGELSRATVLEEWRKILEVNYWSIFDIARRILEATPAKISKSVVDTMARVSAKLLEHRLMRSHDLTGAVFQKLIADRKFLAAYYTTPPSAALLAGLAIGGDTTPAGKLWADTESLKHLRIADFACGTGTLLSAAYQRVGQFHELAGGDARLLHSYMMGGSLVGCDVLPAAAHLTAATLSSVHPTLKYAESSIMTLAYGKQKDGGVALGSLDLLDPQRRFEILAITAKAAEGTGESLKDIWTSMPHGGFDLVIMNPPFTRATGHEGKKIGVHNPMFAAFAADAETQKIMGRVAANLTANTSAHGNAGEASIFLVLGDRKLKQGGTIALVLPLSFMLGEAWEESRALVSKKYQDLIFVTNAGLGGSDLSFSSDTDMGECLVVGRKGFKGGKRSTFVTLNERPDSTISGTHIASSIQSLISHSKLRKLEDGPLGGTPLLLGSELVGHAVSAPTAEGWNLARVRDFSTAQSAYQLSLGKLWLPSCKQPEPLSLPMTKIKVIAQIGPYHADINGRTAKGEIRGPFDIHPAPTKGVPTYPVLWSHDAERERAIAFEAESEAIPVVGSDFEEQALIDDKIEKIWATASFVHFNRDFRFNSQSTAMQFTKRKTIGGRAWLSLKLANKRQEKALALWGNSTLGLLLYWWLANKQQAGRGSIGKSALQDLTILDVTKLSEIQLRQVEDIFDAVAGEPLRPLNELHSDTNRQVLDRRLMVDVLGLPDTLHAQGGPMDLLRMKLAAEPSIVGHKKPEKPQPAYPMLTQGKKGKGKKPVNA
ncbi:hypothetical protein ABIG06_001708 [Bradyrhizobium sp. USDA 326]|uniref:hypothetical protein n=1 Tax=Bradyrhizobium sp. USDA 326 TaxID=3377726 RepID=UPI003C7858B1